MIHALLLAAAAVQAPASDPCATVASGSEAALAYADGLQGFIYGFPIVDMLNRMHNETHLVRPNQPLAAPVNTFAMYDTLITPKIAENLRAPNVDTLYLNGWVDLSTGPVLLDVPAMGSRYYTLAFMDLYGKPQHLGTRTNGGAAARYALVGPSGGTVPDGYQPFPIATDIAWLLGRVLVTSPADLPVGRQLAQGIVMRGQRGAEVTAEEPTKLTQGIQFFTHLNRALKRLPAIRGEEALMAGFNRAGFGPAAEFDTERLSPARRQGLECALRLGPDVLKNQGFKPTRTTNGWQLSDQIANPGMNYLLRAAVARGGYANDPVESIYPGTTSDGSGAPLDGANRYRVRFGKGQFPPARAFWSLTVYDTTGHLVENPMGRYAIGDRTPGLRYGRDGSLEITLSATRPRGGASNWLPTPAQGGFMVVARLYLPEPAALDGRYAMPPIERLP